MNAGMHSEIGRSEMAAPGPQPLDTFLNLKDPFKRTLKGTQDLQPS